MCSGGEGWGVGDFFQHVGIKSFWGNGFKFVAVFLIAYSVGVLCNWGETCGDLQLQLCVIVFLSCGVGLKARRREAGDSDVSPLSGISGVSV